MRLRAVPITHENVFLSHSSRDQRFVEQEIIPLLSAHAVLHWYSSEHIATAEQWTDRIFDALQQSDAVAVVLSADAVESEWVKKEVSWAFENRRKVVPILLSDCRRAALHPMLESINHVDYRGPLRRARTRLLAVWSRVPTRRFALLQLAAMVGWVLRGKYWRQRRVVMRAAIATVLGIVASFAAILTVQDPVARALSGGLPASVCHVEPYGSAVQIFEKGWLVARFETAEFFSIREGLDGEIRWRRFADTYKSGSKASCSGVEAEALLSAGFRKLYCGDAPELSTELGAPRTPEVKAFIQFQDWSGGLLMFGLPSTEIGMMGDEHKFTRLTGAFLAGSGQPTGRGISKSWTERTLPIDDVCSAIWYRLVDGRESPLLSKRCGNHVIHADALVRGRLSCARVGT
jgi:hypothetical protein